MNRSLQYCETFVKCYGHQSTGLKTSPKTQPFLSSHANFVQHPSIFLLIQIVWPSLIVVPLPISLNISHTFQKQEIEHLSVELE